MKGFAPVATAGGLVYASGVVPSPEACRQPIEGQVADVLRRVDFQLAAAGSSLARALSLHVQVRRASDFAAMNAAYAPLFGADPPVRTTVVAPPESPRALVEVSAVAAAAGAEREVLRPDGWQPSPNPYSYAARSGDIVFMSGLVPRDGRTNTVVQGDLATQAAVIFDNASDVLRAAGLSLADVVSARVFLTDAAHAPALDQLYRQRMPSPRPARCTLVAALMNPNYLVEMTFVAMAGKRALSRPTRAPVAEASESEGIVAGARLFVSGTAGVDLAADVEGQTKAAAGRLAETLRAAGLDWSHVADVTLCVSDPAQAPRARHALREAIGRPLPAGSTLVCGLIGAGACVEVLLTAVHP